MSVRRPVGICQSGGKAEVQLGPIVSLAALHSIAYLYGMDQDLDNGAIKTVKVAVATGVQFPAR